MKYLPAKHCTGSKWKAFVRELPSLAQVQQREAFYYYEEHIRPVFVISEHTNNKHFVITIKTVNGSVNNIAARCNVIGIKNYRHSFYLSTFVIYYHSGRF